MSTGRNKIAIHQVENHLFVEKEKCTQAKEKAIRENKIESEIEVWGDMADIYGDLLEHLSKMEN